MSEHKEAPKPHSLMSLKKTLYGGQSPIIHTTSSMKVSEFMEAFFPAEFYLGSFTDEAGGSHSLKALLSDSGQGPKSQRSRIFNMKYYSDLLTTEVVAILKLRSDLWTDICTNCYTQLSGADLPRLFQLLMMAATAMGDASFVAWVENTFPEAPERALAAVLLSALCQGTPARLESVFSGGKPLREQLDYMTVSLTMMKRSFRDILSATSFEDIRPMYENYSSLLAPVTTITRNGKGVRYSHLLDELYSFLLDNVDAKSPDFNAGNKLIRIVGPAGCEKNSITQLLFLRLYHQVRAMARTESVFAPFYINLSHYRRVGLLTKEDLQAQLTADLAAFLEFCKNNPQRKPILFVDGVKSYRFDGCEIDYLLNTIIQRDLPGCRLVVATENSVLPNRSRQRMTPFFATGDYLYQVQLSSLHLPETERADEYLERFQTIYAPEMPPKAIKKKLLDIFLEEIDTYQLRLVCPHLKDAKNIASLYETVCLNYMEGDTSEWDNAALWAFHFSYTDEPLPHISQKMLELLTAHQSVLEYFIARWYMTQVKKKAISDLDMVLPRGVTRFVTPLLNRSSAAESAILALGDPSSFEQMGIFARDEVAYWLGRLHSPNKALKADGLLMEHYQKQLTLVDSIADKTGLNYLHQVFLLRGLAVSLILQGHSDISTDLLHRLMSDPVANEINRGFHLDYYGDRHYIPDDGICFDDDITVGEHSLAYLLSSIEQGINETALPPLFELNLFSVCSMLQARTEEYVPEQNFDVVYYLGQAKKHLDWYLSRPFLKDSQVRYYFEMALRDFSQRLKQKPQKWSHLHSDVYDLYQTRIPRTGWVNRKIPQPESVAEHSYNMYLLGMLFLPESHPKVPTYSKQTVLELTLIHDLAEAVTGDINKPDKQHNLEHFRMLDEQEMGILLLRDTYPSMPEQIDRYTIWKLWNTEDFNALVAKDLDMIQTMYQLLLYRSKHPELFDKDDFIRWMGERNVLKTDLGIEIYKNVIQKNKRFAQQLSELDKKAD